MSREKFCRVTEGHVKRRICDNLYDMPLKIIVFWCAQNMYFGVSNKCVRSHFRNHTEKFEYYNN